MINSYPLGDFVFYIDYKINEVQCNYWFSSPLGAFAFYMELKECATEELTIAFSSPLGEFVFYIDMVTERC